MVQWSEALLYEFADVLSVSDDDLGRTTIVKHQIDIGDATPVRQPPRRLPFHQQEMIQQHVDKKTDGLDLESPLTRNCVVCPPASSTWLRKSMMHLFSSRKSTPIIHSCVNSLVTKHG